MSEHVMYGKIKPFGKWIVLGIVLVGASTWAGLKWLGEAVTTDVVVKKNITTGGVVAATAFSFCFDDRTCGLKEYTDHAYALAIKGDKNGAVDYVDRLIGAFDQQIPNLEKEAKKEALSVRATDTTTTATTMSAQPVLPANRRLKWGQNGRKGLELVRINIRLLTQQISEEEWLKTYNKLLNADIENSGDIVWVLTICTTDKNFPAERMETLLKQNLPPQARGKLAMWLFRYKRPHNDTPLNVCEEFYERVLSYCADAQEGSLILTAYVMELGNRKESAAIKEILENYISLFYNSDFGFTAACHLIAREPNEASQDEMIIAYSEKYPGSFMAEGMECDYAAALLARGDYKKAVEVADTEGKLKKVKTSREAALVLMALVQSIEMSKGNTPSSVCATISHDFYEEGDFASSIELSFETLKSINALPVNLLTQRPIRSIADVINPGNAKDVELGARYFLCAIGQKMGKPEYKRNLLDELRKEKVPSSLEPYVLGLLIDDAMANQNWNIAKECVTRAIALVPESEVLANLQNQIDLKCQQATIRERIVSKQQRLLQEISKAKTDEEAIRSYEKLAELYLAANDMEQSLGIYMKVVDKYPKHIMAPTCLSYAISLLEQSDKDKYASRINILVDRLKKSYPESPEAKKYLAETIPVLK